MKTRHLEMCGCRRANHRAHPASLACAAPTRRPASAMRRGLDARTASRRWCVEMRLARWRDADAHLGAALAEADSLPPLEVPCQEMTVCRVRSGEWAP